VTRRTLGDKLQEIGRRSPKDVRALEVLADMVLARLDAQQVADPTDYHWRCDDPKKGGGR
jgi:hypothetical protein